MKLNVFILFLGLVTHAFDSFAQEEINQTDAQGLPHGIWKKYYDGTKQLRYEGEFKHGREVGEFKFYCEDCKNKPIAIKKFRESDGSAEVSYFSKKGKLLSEGKMVGKDRVGEWITYHRNSKVPMIRENYKDGKLNGRRTVYYPDGTITEELDYQNGLKNGENIYYSRRGVVIKRLQYKEDKLHGPAIFYDGHGNVVVEGAYLNGRQNGLWKYYKDGKLVLEEILPKKHKK